MISPFSVLIALLHVIAPAEPPSVPPDTLFWDSVENFAPIHEAAKLGEVAAIRGEIEKGAPVDLRVNNRGGRGFWRDTTPLMWAASRGHLHAVQFLVESGADTNARSINGTTPLMAAAGSIKTVDGDPLACLQFLIEAGAKIDAMDNRERTALYYACGNTLNGDFFDTPPDHLLPVAFRLENPFRLVRPGIMGNLAAAHVEPSRFVCSRYGDAARVEALLKAGANVNHTAKGTTVLREACCSSDSTRIRLLLSANAQDKLVQGPEDWNLIDTAATYGTAETVNLILAAGFESHFGSLIRAAGSREDAAKKVKLLMMHGADPNENHPIGGTPLMNALKQPDSTDAAIVLLAAGADPSVRTKGKESIWISAAKNGSASTLKRLVEMGFSATARSDAIPHSPTLVLAAASPIHSVQKVKLLLELGTDVNCRDDNGTTPILAAAKAGNMETVVELVRQGANVAVSDAFGCSPLYYVANRGGDSDFLCKQTGGAAARMLIKSGVISDLEFGRATIAAAQCEHHEFLEALIEAKKASKPVDAK